MISVIIPAYNVGDYISECIESLLSQTYKKLEIIIVNDGSTDNTQSIIEAYQQKNCNIKCINILNKGVSVARNVALKYAKGEFVIFIDPDDFLNNEMLEKMIRKMRETDSDVAICGYVKYFNEKCFENIFFNIDSNKIYNSYEILDLLLKQRVKGFLWNKLFKRKDLEKVNFEFEEGRYIQDYFPVFKQLVNSDRVVFIDEPLYYYRQRETSITGKKNEKILIDYFYAINSILNYIDKNNLNVNEKSFKRFKAYIQCEIIHRFYDCNAQLGLEIYKRFSEENYYIFDSTINEIRKLDADIKIKVKLFLWKFKIFHLFKR